MGVSYQRVLGLALPMLIEMLQLWSIRPQLQRGKGGGRSLYTQRLPVATAYINNATKADTKAQHIWPR